MKPNFMEEYIDFIAEDQISDNLSEEDLSYKDKYVRLYADFENFKKNKNKERFLLEDNLKKEILLKFLSVFDDLDRGISLISESDDTVHKGIKMTHSKFKRTLYSFNLEHIESIGQKFNDELHEAISTLKVEDESQVGVIVDELEKGYKMNGKVIRFSKVIVGEI